MTAFWAALIAWLLSLFKKKKDFARMFYGFQFLHCGQGAPDSHIDNTLQFFSTTATDRDRQWWIDRAVERGENAICAFVFNYGRPDGGEGRVSIMRDPDNIESGISQIAIDDMEDWISKAYNKGVYFVLIMACCESNPIQRKWSDYICDHADEIAEKIVPQYNKYDVLWCTLLEVEKNFNPGDRRRPLKLYQAIRARTTNPLGVGIHGCTARRYADCCDWFGFEQEGNPAGWNGRSPADFWEQIRGYISSVSKPVLVMEYSLGRKNERGDLQGLAAAFQETSPCIGYGNGGPKGLTEFMRDTPKGMLARRAGNIITVSWSDGSQARVADLQAGTFWKV